MNERSIGMLGLAAAVGLWLLLWMAAAMPAQARDRGTFSMEILVDGVPLEEYHVRSTTYVEAMETRDYAIRLTNRTAGRVAVALSVDGLNTIDAKTSSAKQASKWILGPWETITLKGWQTGQNSARRFYFTTEEQSYGAWLGKTRNLGIISAAVFRERQPEPTPIYRPRLKKPSQSSAPSTDSNSAGEPVGSQAERSGDAGLESKRDAGRLRESEAQPAPTDDMAATGIGTEIDHRVRKVQFEAESSPATVVEIRYEYRDTLIRLGALRPSPRYWQDPLDRRERARGFEDLDFAPDPFAR